WSSAMFSLAGSDIVFGVSFSAFAPAHNYTVVIRSSQAEIINPQASVESLRHAGASETYRDLTGFVLVTRLTRRIRLTPADRCNKNLCDPAQLDRLPRRNVERLPAPETRHLVEL